MTELSHSNQNFVTSKQASLRVGYSPDYITRLAREKKVLAKRQGRQWLVEINSVKYFTLLVEADRRERQKSLREERRLEQLAAGKPRAHKILVERKSELRQRAVLETFAIVACLSLTALMLSVVRTNHISSDSLVAGVGSISSEFQTALSPMSFFENFDSWWWFIKREQTVTWEWSDGDTKSVTTEVERHRAHQRTPQVDVDSGELIVSADGEWPDNPSQFVSDAFSDNVAIEFANSRAGTVAPSFQEEPAVVYPFRLETNPVSQ